MKKIICQAIIITISYSTYAASQQQNLWTTFTTANGLANNYVKAIIESSDGALWFGTWGGGVSRYQQGNWTTFTMVDGLAYNGVNAIIESSDGALWFGTGKGVSRFQQGIWRTFTTADGLTDNYVMVIMESSDGALWFGTEGGGVSRYQKGNWTTFTTADGLADNYIRAIMESSDGALWFGTGRGGVSRYQKGNWTTFTAAEGLADNSVSAITESSDGALWFGIYGGVSRYQQGVWTTFTTADGLASNDIRAIIESSDGALWFGTWGGISSYQHGIWTTFTMADGLADNYVFAVIESSDGALWFGTWGGVSRYQQEIWTTFTTADGLVSNDIRAIIESSDGALWFGTGGGVSRYQQDIWTTLTTTDGLVSNDNRAIIESSDSALWFGTEEGLSRYQHGIWMTFTTVDGLANNSVRAIMESSDSALWFGTWGGGVSRYQEGIWTTFTRADGMGYNYVFAIMESSDGALWFGTGGGGVSRYQQGIWRTFTSDDGMAHNVVMAIMESSDGALWFGTRHGGVTCYQQGIWTTFTTTDGLASNDVGAIIESSDGALWFGTGGGVSRYQKGNWTTFTTADGLASNDVYAIMESSDGAFWFGTGGGINRVKPDKKPPITFILKGPENNDIMGTSTPLFIFSAKDYRTDIYPPQFSWSIIDTNKLLICGDSLNFVEDTIIQPNIPESGIYVFKAKAKDKWGNIDPTPAIRIFTVDITQPTVTIISPNQEEHIRGNLPILGSAFDNSPIQDFWYYELSYSSEAEPHAWKLFHKDTSEVKNGTLGNFDTYLLEDESYQLKLWAIDTLKHTSEDVVIITIDNTPPQVKITHPKPDEKISNLLNIQATISDLNIYEYLLEYKMPYDSLWQNLKQDTLSQSLEDKTIYRYENSTDSGGVYLKLTAWDKADNSSSDSVRFILDNQNIPLPTAFISEPSHNSYLNGWISIIGYATDKEFASYSLHLKSQNIDTLLIESTTKKENEELFAFDTNSFPDDNYTLSLLVTNSKNYQNTMDISITIDNTDPIAKITSPIADTINCLVQIEGEATDKNLKNLSLKYAKVTETDSSKFNLIDTTFTYWNTMELDGYYTLFLIVEDHGDLKTIDQQTYYIDNPRFKERDGLERKQAEFSLYIPPNGYNSSVICLEKRDIDEFDYNLDDVMPTELICEIHSSIEEKDFNKPVVLTIDYNSINLTNFNEDNFYIFTYHENKWDPIGGTVDRDNKTITTTINQIGIYGLFENNIPLTESKKDLNLSFQPRIFSPQGGGHDTQTAISFELGKESNVTIKIYNPAGRLVKVLTENENMSHGNNVIYWDGKDQQGEFCVSGLYIVTIQAEEKMATKTVVVLNK